MLTMCSDYISNGSHVNEQDHTSMVSQLANQLNNLDLNHFLWSKSSSDAINGAEELSNEMKEHGIRLYDQHIIQVIYLNTRTIKPLR